jgi:hypothetical protein
MFTGAYRLKESLYIHIIHSVFSGVREATILTLLMEGYVKNKLARLSRHGVHIFIAIVCQQYPEWRVT